MSRLPFEGIHVLDFTWYAVGPVTTKYLADNGANVVRIESAARLDGLRLAPPWKDAQPGVDNSQFFRQLQYLEAGPGAGHEQSAGARNFPQDAAVGRRRDRELHAQNPAQLGTRITSKMRAIKPDLIMLSTCMQGQTGPNRDYPGLRQPDGSAIGFLLIFPATPRRSRVRPTAHIPILSRHDFPPALLSARSTIAAAPARANISTWRSTKLRCTTWRRCWSDYFATGRVQGPAGNRSERYAPHGAYRCADEDGHERWIAIAVADDNEWRTLVSVLGNPPIDARFATMRGRFHDQAALDEMIGSFVRSRSAEELTIALQAAGVSAYPVQNCMDLHRDENLEEFGFWQWLDHKEMGSSPYEGLEHRMSRTPGSLRRAAPVLGQHSEEVLREILGMTDTEIEELKHEQVVY